MRLRLHRLLLMEQLLMPRRRCVGVLAKETNPRATFLERVRKGPGLKEFINVKHVSPVQGANTAANHIPYLDPASFAGNGRKVHFEIYGCQMNTNDTEVVWAIMQEHGYARCSTVQDADVIMLVTCAIRDGAEQKIWNRLKHLHAMKAKRSAKRGPLQITVLGCMAERLKERLLEQERCVDVIAGPDSYKDLPRLLAVSRTLDQAAVNVLLSLDETYADVTPVRLNADTRTAFVSIMRGCDNLCTYCIVPYTRGRERSRALHTVVREVQHLAEQGVKEVTLLGQNVNSYRDTTQAENNLNASRQTSAASIASGFTTVYKPKVGGVRFAELLVEVARAVPEVRVRFTSPHPKDFANDVLYAIRDHPNVCNSLHLPAQSGSDTVLARMRRGYTRQAYLQLVEHIRSLLPDVAFSSDFICGFCGETEAEFAETLTLIEKVRYNVAFLFAYSMRERTAAHRRYDDDVSANVKTARLQRMVQVFRRTATALHQQYVGQDQLILIEGRSKRSADCWFGRNDANVKVIVPATALPLRVGSTISEECRQSAPGDFVVTKITASNSQVLHGDPLYISSISNFYTKVT